MRSPERFDLVLVGGGLANGLVLRRLREKRPDLTVLMLEAGETVGGNHTWSFHEHDLTIAEGAWVAPFVAHVWPDYEVRFPLRRRRIGTGYRSATSDRFAALIGECGPAVRTGAPVAMVEPRAVTLGDGTRIEAGAVLDGRGHAASPHVDLVFQKFLGLEIELEAPHGLERPIVMDATVEQDDGYRFVYVLPFAADRLLVEDTYYADGDALDAEALRRRLADYCTGHGWRVRRIVREEQGVLPIAVDGDIRRFWDERGGIPASGLAAVLFHPTTGYSLPDAVRLADRIASAPDLSADALFALTRDHSVQTWEDRRFFRGLNRMLFFAGEASRRYEILQHFHRLPDDLVGRFYATNLSAGDKLRILTGRPPVPISNAIRALAMSRRSMKESA
ncbi:lycopene beta-cyclase CrtY [Aureimonas leprariae]|uniref:Lycopene beta-cyclase CrtY n=1 Tax=Plantimonas leprariae TaxID=2615207 RepID=A0A7V7TYC6_9HYPH|nr:lycopene beta-cyclase CrtY [Aureimonas leprariae]KAB0682572.1 lycopene beta-cyclase CrtY [Aureimonas leprariae]